MKRISIFISIGLISCLVSTSSASRSGPNADGGYDVVLAVEKGTIEPKNITAFLESIQDNLMAFSSLMHTATDKHFFVKSAKIIVPYHWSLPEYLETNISKIENFNNADIRLSASIVTPHVENSNLCESPGQYIELPLEFFTSIKYGDPSKSLLMAWARYRWGVWEEHGYPGDSQFPYFYKDPSFKEWHTTGCSDVPLNGDYMNVTTVTSTCEPSNSTDPNLPDYPPEGGCRFKPKDENQTATSSLAYFPWLSSITSFCTESTHNVNAPNKQNLYCGYKSVMNVITNSFDANATVSQVDPVPAIDFQINVESRKPLLYFLVDTGSFNIPEEILESITNITATLFSDPALQGVITQGATYPTSSSLHDTAIDVQIPWDTIDPTSNDFIALTDQFRTTQSIEPGSFTLALQEVIDELRAIDHPRGAVILVLKHGFTSLSFGHAVYESDLIANLQTDNIVVHALEIKQNNLTPKLNLASISAQSGGHYLAVDGSTEVAGPVSAFISKVAQHIEDFQPVQSLTKAIFMGFLKPSQVFQIPFHTASLPSGTKVVFSMTLNRDVTVPVSPWISIENAPGGFVISMEQFKFEWNENSADDNRLVINNFFILQGQKFSENVAFRYDGCTPIDKCTAYVVVSYELPEPADDSNLTVDLDINDAEIPVMIFVKITQNGQPVVGVNSVMATLNNLHEQVSTYSIPLMDDGPNAIDINREDGVYSGAFVPTANGIYKLIVTVSGQKATWDFLLDHVHRDSAVQSLLLQDQTIVGCSSTFKGCSVSGLDAPVLHIETLKGFVNVATVDSFENHVGRILDLDAVAMPENMVMLTLKAPPVFSATEISGLMYDFRTSGDVNQLRSDFDNCGKANVVEESEDCKKFERGKVCTVKVSEAIQSPKFYAVRLTSSSGMTEKAQPSNVFGVVPSSSPVPTTTTTTTISPSTSRPSTTTQTTTKGTTKTTSEAFSSSTESSKAPEYWYQTTEATVTFILFVVGILGIVAAVAIKAAVQQCLHKDIDGDKEKLTKADLL